MTPLSQRTAMALLDGLIWYKERNGSDAANDYWGVARLGYPPEGRLGNPKLKGTVSETRLMTADEIAEAVRTGEYYTYAPEYLEDFNAVRRVEDKVLTSQDLWATYWNQVYYAATGDRVEQALMKHGALDPFVHLRASAAQRVEGILRTCNLWTS